MKWISVEEQLPEPLTDVLCYMKGGTMTVGRYNSIHKYGDWIINIDETYCQKIDDWPLYWMPLPVSPTAE